MSYMKNHLMDVVYENSKKYDVESELLLDSNNHTNSFTEAIILALYCKTRLLQAANETDYDYEFLKEAFYELLEDGQDMMESVNEVYEIALEGDY